MFKFFSRSQNTDSSHSPLNNEPDSSNKLTVKWQKPRTLKNIQRAIDGTLSSITEYIVDKANAASYDAEFRSVQREVMNNERVIGKNKLANPEFDSIRQTLFDHYQYQQKTKIQSNPPPLKKSQDLRKLNNSDNPI